MKPRRPGPWPLFALAAAGLAGGGRAGYAVAAIALLALAIGLLAMVSAVVALRTRALRHLPAVPVEAGDDLAVELSLQLPRIWPLAVARLRDFPPKGLGAPQQTSPLILARRRITLRYTLPEVCRGVHLFSSLELEIGDPAGFFGRRTTLDCPGTLTVYPRRVALAAAPEETFGAPGDDVVRGTRDFAPGDPPGRLHAARTAQRGYPQVRELERGPAKSRMVCVDAMLSTEPDIELLLSVAASLATAWLRRRVPVGLLLAGAPALAADETQEQETRILSALAAADQDTLKTNPPPGAPTPADEVWLLTSRPAGATGRPPADRVLAVGEAAGRGALRQLSDLPAYLGGPP